MYQIAEEGLNKVEESFVLPELQFEKPVFENNLNVKFTFIDLFGGFV